MMIGQTLQSMLVILYRRHQHTLHSTGREGEPLAASRLDGVLQQKSRQTEKHRHDGRITQLTGLRVDWIAWEGVIGFTVVSAAVTSEKREVTSSHARMSGTKHDVPADCCRDVWRVLGQSGVEWGEGHPCKMGLWEAGRVEVKRAQVFSSIIYGC